MTITAERTAAAVKDPRELVGVEVFDVLAAYVSKHDQVTLPYAEGVVGQTLVWLKACADNPRLRLAMSDSVDPGWHAFILHSQDYADFCDRLFGRYFHHVPPAPGMYMNDDCIARTLPALRATGYPVDETHWAGRLYPCCPPNPCTAVTEEEPHAADPTAPEVTAVARA
ncbi:hypothetical protein [Actinomadura fibrosa]|uniref:Uncharacterized protein n=1 Tax=Actinomadura fibrosa TaxID=111802 RepID=A0ABW2XV27_9ACTN|nr:hypothetical protein [Actinomadura fibrosa]